MNGKDKPLRWATGAIALGSAPLSYESLDSLKAQGVGAILNLCGEYCDLHEVEADEGFEVYYLPIADERAPDMAALERALDWLDEAVWLGKKVFIHCKHGVGRTGTVVTAYLLRKGMSRSQAARKLKAVQAGPGNFEQWWFLRGFSKKSGTLSIREPSLESGVGVDLRPVFERLEAVHAAADERWRQAETGRGRCGEDHDRCCRMLVELGLAETAYLSWRMNLLMGQPEREACVARAAAFLRSERSGRSGRSGSAAPDEAPNGRLCPLSEYGLCGLFDFRPLVCRLRDMDEPGAPEADAARAASGHPGLAALDRELLAAYAPGAACPPPRFSLAEAASGRYVASFFQNCLSQCELPGAPSAKS